MGKSDITARMYLKDKKRFADFFNGTVFQGRQVVKPSELSSCDTRSEVVIPGIGRKNKEVERFRDIAMNWNKGVRLAILACENQAKVHYAMPLRAMLYDGVMYTDQASDKWKARPQEKVTDAEFLSQFRKEDKLVPIITLVFYYGADEWDGSINLHQMLDVAEMDEELLRYIPNYHINLITPDGGVEKELFQTDLQQIFGMLECRGNKEKLKAYMEQEKDYFGHLDRETATAVSVFLGSETIKNKVMANQKEETMDMCKALQDIYNDGVGEGRAEGRASLLTEMIQKKLAKGLSIEEIPEMLETTEEEVRRLM